MRRRLGALGELPELAYLLVAVVNPLAKAVPDDLFFPGHRTVDMRLARLHVDHDVVGMRQRIGGDNPQRLTQSTLYSIIVFTYSSCSALFARSVEDTR